MAMAATTRPRAWRTAGPDRITVMLITLAGFLAVLALMAGQLRGNVAVHANPPVVLRRIYITRVVETVPASARGGSSVTESVSSSGTSSPAAGPTTRSS
jgi:hypothetical protein